MSHGPLCINPPKEGVEKNSAYNLFSQPERLENMKQLKPYQMEVEMTNKCYGSCLFCFSFSNEEGDVFMATDRIKSLLQEAYELGVRIVDWCGGEPLLHPDWYEIMEFASELGLKNFIATSGLVSKQDARRIASLGDQLDFFGFNIDTINPQAYNKLHSNPKTLEARIQGYKNVLEAGYPPERVTPVMTLTKPAAETFEETLDWLVDEMGTTMPMILQFKNEGWGKDFAVDYECGLGLVKKVLEYRAKKLGSHWLKIGTSDADRFCCRTIFGVKFNGNIVPCTIMNEGVGNIYSESLKDIVDKHRETLFYNFELEGPCGECEHSDLCTGCRVTALYYTGNIKASDPKCYMNPEAKEYYLQ